MEDERDLAEAALRRAIMVAFPPIVFNGAVTPSDDDEWAEEIDDDLDLRDNLRNRAWNEVPPEVIDRQASGLPLLTPEAFAAFLPAWLIRSLERLSEDNEVREFTVYAFCQSAHPEVREHQRIRHGLLNREQRKAVVDFLVLMSRHERDRYLRASADEALSSIQETARPFGVVSDKRS